MKKVKPKIKPKKRRRPVQRKVQRRPDERPKLPVPMFLKFINKKMGAVEILQSFARAADPITAKAAGKVVNDPPDLEKFRVELADAVTDVINDGVGREFVAFVDHYMKDSLEEDLETERGERGVNVSRWARVKDEKKPWVQGFICYNLSLYIKAFGLDALKKCKVCSTFFNHKGKWAVYCSDQCKSEAKVKKI